MVDMMTIYYCKYVLIAVMTATGGGKMTSEEQECDAPPTQRRTLSATQGTSNGHKARVVVDMTLIYTAITVIVSIIIGAILGLR